MTDLERAMEQITEMGTRGWRLRVEFDYNGTVDDISGTAGDSNCHHPKEYDRADGHGFSTFECMQDSKYADKEKKQWVEGPISTEWLKLMGEHGVPFPEAVAFAYRHIMAIAPGAPHPK